MDDCRTRLVVLLFGDPHLLESGQGGQDGATDPYRVLALWRSDDLDLHGGRSKGLDLLLHSVRNAGVHGGTTRQNGVGVQVFTDVDITLHDGVVGGLVDTGRFHTQERRLEHGLRTAESLVADGDDLTVGKLVALLETRGQRCCLHLLIKVQSHVAQLLLDVTHDFSLGSGGEAVATLRQDLHQVVRQVTASQIQSHDGVGQGITLVDGHSVGHTVTRVQDDTCGTTRGVQGQHGLDGHVHGWGVEGLEHDLRHFLTVGLGVEGGLCEQDRVLLGGHTQLVVEGVVPDLLHVVPVGDNAVLDGVLEGQDSTLALSLVSHIAVFLAHSHHHTLHTERWNRYNSLNVL